MTKYRESKAAQTTKTHNRNQIDTPATGWVPAPPDLPESVINSNDGFHKSAYRDVWGIGSMSKIRMTIPRSFFLISN